VDEAGQPVARFSLTVRNEATRQELNLTFANGQWRVDAVTPGTLQLVARDATGTFMGTLNTRLEAGGAVDGLEIMMHPLPESPHTEVRTSKRTSGS